MKIIDLFKDKDIVKSFSKGSGNYVCDSILKKAILIANGYLSDSKKYLVVCNSLHTASLMYEYLSNLVDSNSLFTYFADETIRIEALAESKEMLANRIYALNNAIVEEAGIFITHTSAFLRYLPNKEQFEKGIKRIVVGQTINKKEFEMFLSNIGYKKVNKVCNTLEYSSRGGVVDFFSIKYDYPGRMEFFDDEIESIRYFDLEKQTTIKVDDHVLILPASELIISDVSYSKEVLLKGLEDCRGKCSDEQFDLLRESVLEDVERLETNTYSSSLYKYYSLINECSSLMDYVNPDVCVLMDKPSIDNNYNLLIKESVDYKEELFESGKVLKGISLYHSLNDLLVESKKIIMLNDFQSRRDEEYFYLTPLINCNGSSKMASRFIQIILILIIKYIFS